jgi:cytochrome c peroxidase
MEWCLACHRHPETRIRPRAEVFNMTWKPRDQAALGARLVKDYGVRSARDLMSCSTCHR